MRVFTLLLCLFLMAGMITNAISTTLNNSAAIGLPMSDSKVFADWVNSTLPTIGEPPGHKILAIGASQTFFGIYPVAMDAEFVKLGIDTTSYNMAFPALDPTTVEFLARHIRSSWGDQAKLDVLLVGFAPHFYTKKYAENEAFNWHNLVVRAQLGPGFQDLLFLHKQAIQDGLQTLAMQLLNVEPGRPREIVMELIEGAKPQECAQYIERNRGGETCDKGFSYRGISIMHRNGRDRQADLLGLRLDTEELDRLVRAIGIAKQFAKHVFVVLTPRNMEIVNTTPEGIERLKDGLSYISQQADVEIIDFYSEYSGYDIESFKDATHLNSKGARRFSAELADAISQHLILNEGDG